MESTRASDNLRGLFLALVQSGMYGSAVPAQTLSCLKTLQEDDWNTLQAMARRQTVSGLLYSAVNQLPEDIVVPARVDYALMAGADFYEAYTVILTTGVAATGTLPGEAELVGRGVSYCATCDGNLYRGKTIGVICGAARFEHEAAFLAGLAKKMYFFPLYQSAASFGENTEVTADRPVAVLSDGKRVSGVKLKSGTELPLDGLFCLRDSVSLAALLPDLAMEDGHIATDRSMKTNLPGCFAAGDCTGRPYQYVKAAGEGNVAAHSAIAYLAGKQ